MSRLGWYFETWRTPYWRGVVTTVLAVGAFVGWEHATDLARDRIAAGDGGSAAARAALPGLAVFVVLGATALWLAVRGARADGRATRGVFQQAALLVAAAAAWAATALWFAARSRIG